MTPQQEYERFIIKLAKSSHELHNDFENMSAKAKELVTISINNTLQTNGIALSIENLLKTIYDCRK